MPELVPVVSSSIKDKRCTETSYVISQADWSEDEDFGSYAEEPFTTFTAPPPHVVVPSRMRSTLNMDSNANPPQASIGSLQRGPAILEPSAAIRAANRAIEAHAVRIREIDRLQSDVEAQLRVLADTQRAMEAQQRDEEMEEVSSTTRPELSQTDETATGGTPVAETIAAQVRLNEMVRATAALRDFEKCVLSRLTCLFLAKLHIVLVAWKAYRLHSTKHKRIAMRGWNWRAGMA